MIINQGLYDQLFSFIHKNNISLGENLRNHTYIKLGGKADVFLTPTTYDEVQNIVRFSINENIPLTIIGNGTNLIVRDGGIRGIVVSLKNFDQISVNEHSIIVQSGANIATASKRALEHNLSGFEFACGIPGTVGGAINMNAGAYGGEIKDILEYCVVINSEGEIEKREAKDLDLSYRHSNISQRGDIVLEAKFNLTPGIYSEIKSLMDDFTSRRKSNQPLEYPSCGCVFKRPPGYYAGKLIQDSNLQGLRIGGAEVSRKHAGFIVNINNATASEYIDLIEHVQKTVKDKFNVFLETEVKIIGEDLE